MFHLFTVLPQQHACAYLYPLKHIHIVVNRPYCVLISFENKRKQIPFFLFFLSIERQFV